MEVLKFVCSRNHWLSYCSATFQLKTEVFWNEQYCVTLKFQFPVWSIGVKTHILRNTFKSQAVMLYTAPTHTHTHATIENSRWVLKCEKFNCRALIGLIWPIISMTNVDTLIIHFPPTSASGMLLTQTNNTFIIQLLNLLWIITSHC